MTDDRETEVPSGRNATVNVNPVAAVRREELKYAYRSRRETPAIRENRKLLAEHIAAIEPDPAPQPVGKRLEIAERYRGTFQLAAPAVPHTTEKR